MIIMGPERRMSSASLSRCFLRLDTRTEDCSRCYFFHNDYLVQKFIVFKIGIDWNSV